MAEYELDVAAGQLVHWLIEERAAAGRRKRFEMHATREYVTDPAANLETAGVSEDAELASLTTIGTLEITPVHDLHPWLLRVRVEDVVGPHAPLDESVADEPEEIDLDAFEADFITPDQGNVFITLEAETERAKEDFELLFADVLRNRHRG